jgi:hypothetical protein
MQMFYLLSLFNKQAHIVRWLKTLLSLYRLSYIFSSNSGVIGSFFLVGTANLLFAPSKIFFTKKDSVRKQFVSGKESGIIFTMGW